MKMESIEKIFKREDGTRVKVYIRISGYYRFEVECSVSVCQPGKRKFTDVVSTDDYYYRISKNQNAYVKSKALEVVTEAEVREVADELFERLRKSEITFMP